VDEATAEKVASRLEALFGVAFRGSIEEFEGGTYLSIRPVEPARPNGFSITIARTPARVEAMFRADSFSKALIRQLSMADSVMKETFSALRSGAETAGYRVNVMVGGEVIPAGTALPESGWSTFDLECDQVLRDRPPQGFGQVDVLCSAASACVGLLLSLLQLENLASAGDDGEGLPEGAKVKVHVNRYERSPVNRAACLAYYGFKCQVCGMDFESQYGEVGANYIEVHHLTPVSQLGENYRVNAVRDLIPVCCNCHAIIHRRDPPMAPAALKQLLLARSAEQMS